MVLRQDRQRSGGQLGKTQGPEESWQPPGTGNGGEGSEKWTLEDGIETNWNMFSKLKYIF